MQLVDKSILKKVYRKRDKNAHKGDYGHLLVVGGSKLYTGSPGLVALSAYRSGVDLVTVASVKRAADIVANNFNIIAYPLNGDYLETKHLNEIIKLSKNKDAFVIGNGLCREKENLDFVKGFLHRICLPGVVDADGIYALDKKITANRNLVITPHAYEFYILTKEKASLDLRKRIEQVKKYAEKFKTIILLKGHVDVISDGKKVALNKTGCPFLTVGGMGDTLAGICGAILARGVDGFIAACAAAYINGKAGELAAKEFGESVLASDLINNIYRAINF